MTFSLRLKVAEFTAFECPWKTFTEWMGGALKSHNLQKIGADKLKLHTSSAARKKTCITKKQEVKQERKKECKQERKKECKQERKKERKHARKKERKKAGR